MSMRVEEQAIIALFINVSTGFSNLGGDVPGSMTLESIQALGLATNVQGMSSIFRTLDSRRTTRFLVRSTFKILWK